MSDDETMVSAQCVRMTGPNEICGSHRRIRKVEPLGNKAERISVVCPDCGTTHYSYERGIGQPRARGLRARREAEMKAMNMDIEQWSIHKARDWKRRYGAPPASADWNLRYSRSHLGADRVASLEQRHRDVIWPSDSTVRSLFGSWNDFLAEAGFDTVRPGQRRGAKRPRSLA